MKASKTLILLFSFALIGFSCKKSWERPGWDSKVVAPLVKSSLSIKNIIRDTSRVKVNSDNSITLVNRDSIAGVSLDTLVALNTPAFEQTRKVSEIVLDTKKDTTSINMGQILRSAGYPPTQRIFYFPFPITTPVSFNNILIDISQFFEIAKIKTGMLQVDVINDLPLDLTNADFTVVNKNIGGTIFQRTGLNIPKQTTITEYENLAGKLVEGELSGSISATASSGGSGFWVDTMDAITVIMTISGVTVDSATAIFPAQEIVNNTDVVILEGMDDVQLTYAKVKSGYVVAEAVSTIEDSMFFDYIIPGATQGGLPFTSSNALPPAPSNGNISRSFTYDFAGFELDLTGTNQDTVNTFVNQVIGNIKYTGNLISLSLNDSIQMKISTQDLVPSYVEGYLGRDTINIGPETLDLTLFNNIIEGTINFDEADLKLSIENGMGMTATIEILDVTAINTKTSASVSLSPGPNVNNPITIPAATNNPHTFANYQIDLSTAAGYNPEALLNVMPDKIQYSLQIITNPTGVVNLNQFAYLDKTIKANLDMAIPLSIISDNLTLMDTVALNMSAIKKRNVNQGKINVVTDNGFPIEAELEMYLMDEYYNITDTLRSSQTALAALVDGSYRVNAKQRSIISFEADETRMTHLYDSRYVAFKARFNTDPSAVHLKIYSDYSIDFQIVGDVNYRF